jgi:hypothetical protein
MTVDTVPDLRRVWRAVRAPLVIVVLVLATAVLLTLLRGSSRGPLDPASYEPNGAHAIARLLQDRGVEVIVADTAGNAERELAARAATLFVAQPDRVEPAAIRDLTHRAAATVLAAPGSGVLSAVEPRLRIRPGGPEPGTRAPDCSIDAAVAAGPLRLGGPAYSVTGDGTIGTAGRGSECYDGGLVRLGELTVLADPGLLRNDRLAADGTAALALGLLGGHERVVWYLPSPGDAALSGGDESLYDLLPPGWIFGAAQAGVAVLLLALWRARRLGRVVTEPLPVTVRAAETVEGRARLYRRSGAADHAARALRGAALDRILPALGLSGAQPEAVVPAVAQRSGHAAHAVAALLYGPAPEDDAGLVRLADELDELERKIR